MQGNIKDSHISIKPQSQTTNLDIIKQLFESLNDKDKQHFIKSLDSATAKQKVAKTIIESKVTMCPYCHSTHFVKNGTKANTYGQKRNIQNYLCRDCNKSFGDTSNTILFSTKKHISVWETYIHCLVEKYSLRKTAKICNISLNTAFIWRHKILDSLQSMMNEVELNGIIEADETFLRLSFKGNHKNFKLPRLSKHRGTRAFKRGLSKEQVCIPCAINHNGLSLAKISNLGKPTLKDLQNSIICNKIAKGSMFVTDSLRAYLKLSNDMNLNHIRIPSNKFTLGTFNIQMINSYHSRLKAMIKYNFKGVATKYLNNYLVYHNFVNFAKDSIEDKKIILLNFIQKTKCISKYSDIPKKEMWIDGRFVA